MSEDRLNLRFVPLLELDNGASCERGQHGVRWASTSSNVYLSIIPYFKMALTLALSANV